MCDNGKLPGSYLLCFFFFYPHTIFKHSSYFIISFRVLWSMFMLTSGVGLLLWIKLAESCVGGTGKHKCCYGVDDLKVCFMLDETRRAWAKPVSLSSIWPISSHDFLLCSVWSQAWCLKRNQKWVSERTREGGNKLLRSRCFCCKVTDTEPRRAITNTSSFSVWHQKTSLPGSACAIVMKRIKTVTEFI